MAGRIISAVAACTLLLGCAVGLDMPSSTPSPTTTPPSSATAPPTPDQQTPTAAPTPSAGSLTRRCTNRQYGFSVSYPTDWYTNEAVEVDGTQVAACTLFAPFADFEVLPEVINVPIFLKHESGPLPGDGTARTVDGHPAVAVETEVDGVSWYVYYVEIGVQTRFAAFAFDNGSATFETSRAVLDAMIGTLDLDGD